MDLVDVFMRKYRVKFDVKECMKHFSRCGGQRAVECGDDPPGGLSTLSAHQMAHGGVIPHSSSSELGAHQRLARVTSAKGYLAMMAPVVPRRRKKFGKGVERGRMMCPPHLLRFFTVFSTRLSWGLGLLGQTRKPLGRVRLSISRVLVGLSTMHAPTPALRTKDKCTSDIRSRAPHDSSSNGPSGRLVWVSWVNWMGATVAIWARGDSHRVLEDT